MFKVFLKDLIKKPSGGLFLSGNGSNAIKILEHLQSMGDSRLWNPAVIVTDRPKGSAARTIAERFGLPMVECPIASFYRAHGCEKVTLATEQGRRIRELWTADLIEKLRPFHLDFGILGGFVPLTNLAAVLPCLNVHPGDLTYEKNGKRFLVGLHTVPVELAILEHLTSLRSSVILVKPYIPGAVEVDGGHLLGISEPMPLDFQGHSLHELEAVYHTRPSQVHIHGAYKDLLSELAAANQEKLKYAGDHVVYPAVIDDFVQNNFAEAEDGTLFYRNNPHEEYQKIRTVEYHADGRRILIKR